MVQRVIRLAAVLIAAASAWAQAPAQPPTVIKTETKLVLVDVVATNKKGQYIDNLEMKNFKGLGRQQGADAQDLLLRP